MIFCRFSLLLSAIFEGFRWNFLCYPRHRFSPTGCFTTLSAGTTVGQMGGLVWQQPQPQPEQQHQQLQPWVRERGWGGLVWQLSLASWKSLTFLYWFRANFISEENSNAGKLYFVWRHLFKSWIVSERFIEFFDKLAAAAGTFTIWTQLWLFSMRRERALDPLQNRTQVRTEI